MKKRWLLVTVVLGLLLAFGGASGLSTAAGSVLYAKPSASGSGDCSDWANACTLQTALGAASTDDEIWVAQGTHKPTSGTDRNAAFQLKDGVAVYGGFAGTETTRDERDWALHESILSGDIGTVGDDSDNSYHVVTGSGTDATAILDGFTITGGKAAEGVGNDPRAHGGGMYNSGGSPTVTNVTFSGNFAEDGGGMYNNTSSPTLINVTFRGNSADVGGGMYNSYGSQILTKVTFTGNSASVGGGMHNWRSKPTLVNVTFSGNSARMGGGMYSAETNASLSNVTFSGNSAGYWGGGMHNWESSPRLTNVTFSGNSAGRFGGGMYSRLHSASALTNVIFSGNSAKRGGGMFNWTSNPTLTNVIFSGNSARHGGGMCNRVGSSPTLVNVTFSGNSARYGGGMMNHAHAAPTLVNVTFTGNSAAYCGGGMLNDSGSGPTLTNCILWGNTAGEGAQIYSDDTSSASVTYSDIQGGYAGHHNIEADPQFVDAEGRLHVTSPAINRGTNDALPPDTLDVDGDGDTAEKLPFDLDGNPRIFDGTVDMGAYESQIIVKKAYLPLVIKSYLP